MSKGRTTITVTRTVDIGKVHAPTVATMVIPSSSLTESGKAFHQWERERGAERGEYAAEYYVEPGEEEP